MACIVRHLWPKCSRRPSAEEVWICSLLVTVENGRRIEQAKKDTAELMVKAAASANARQTVTTASCLAIMPLEILLAPCKCAGAGRSGNSKGKERGRELATYAIVMHAELWKIRVH